MSDYFQENRKAVSGLLGAVALLALVLGYVLLAGKSPPPEAGPVHVTPTATAGQEEQTETEGTTVVGVSDRDPFAPLPEEAEDTARSDSSPDNSASGKGTGTASGRSQASAKSDSGSSKGSSSSKPSGESSGNAGSDSKKTVGKDSGSKAPQPIGGSKSGGDTPTQQIEVAVIQVTDSAAVVRINGSRTTLYQNVPDPSGVTYVSSLGGGCGWFGTGDLSERFTICQGDSRQLS